MKIKIGEITTLILIIVAMYLIGNSGPLYEDKYSSNLKPLKKNSSSEVSSLTKTQKSAYINCTENMESTEKYSRIREIKTATKLLKEYKLLLKVGYIKPVYVLCNDTLIDLNTANSKKICLINGVGPVTADRIVKYRLINGIFFSKSDLIKVKGIGPKTLKKIGG